MNNQYGAVWGLLAGMALGCAGEQKPAETPPPATETKTAPAKAAPASSPLVQQGMDAIGEQRFEDAAKLLAEAREKSPKDKQAAYYHGVALEGLGKREDAQAAYEAALALDPKLVEAAQNLSALLVEMDQPQKALDVADAGLQVAPQNPGLLGNRALALGALGSPDARAAFVTALEKRPEDGWLRYYYAAVLVLAEEKDAAKAELAKISVSGADLARSVSELYGVLQDFGACQKVLSDALAAAESAELLVRRGRCAVGAKDLAQAEKDFRRATAIAPEDPMGHFYLGRHLLAGGKAAEGKAELKRAVDLGPDTEFGAQAKRALASAR